MNSRVRTVLISSDHLIKNSDQGNFISNSVNFKFSTKNSVLQQTLSASNSVTRDSICQFFRKNQRYMFFEVSKKHSNELCLKMSLVL